MDDRLGLKDRGTRESAQLPIGVQGQFEHRTALGAKHEEGCGAVDSAAGGRDETPDELPFGRFRKAFIGNLRDGEIGAIERGGNLDHQVIARYRVDLD